MMKYNKEIETGRNFSSTVSPQVFNNNLDQD